MVCRPLTICVLSAVAAAQPQAQQGSTSAQDMQAQWAEYYRQLGYAYYGQQPGGQQSAAAGAPPPSSGPEHKVC